LAAQELAQCTEERLTLKDFESMLERLTIVSGTKFYLRKLSTAELASARNMILEIFANLKKGDSKSKSSLVAEVREKLGQNGFQVAESDI